MWIKKIVKLYFEGYSVEESLKLTKSERKQDKLIKIATKYNS